MGFNNSGIAFDSNFEGDQNRLEQALGFRLKPVKEDVHENTLRQGWDETNRLAVIYTRSGTLVFCSVEMMLDHMPPAAGSSMAFGIFETVGAFNFKVSKEGKPLRDFMSSEAGQMTSEGPPLSFETGQDTADNIISGLETFLGQTFFSLPADQKSYVFEIGERYAAEVLSESKPAKKSSVLGRMFGGLYNRKPDVPIDAEEKTEADRRALVEYPKRQANLLDQILALCQKEDNVERAYLAQKYNDHTGQHEFILGIKFSDKNETLVKSKAREIKNEFLSDRELYFVSNHTNADLFSVIETENNPFYVRHEYFGFRELLTRWALDNDAHAKDMEMAIRSTPVTMIARMSKGYPDDNEIILPKDGSHFMIIQDKSDTKPYVPIFTDPAAAANSRHYENANAHAFIEISIPDFNLATRDVYKGTFFILNPSGTPMEFFFKL